MVDETKDIQSAPEVAQENIAEFINTAGQTLGIASEELNNIQDHLKSATVPTEVKKFEEKISEDLAEKRAKKIEEASQKLQKEGVESNDLRFILSMASVAEKLKLAIFGNAACRALLVLDTNHMIQQAVMKNPRIQVNEIETFSKNPFIAENILSMIADNRSWIAHYNIKKNLVFNPKTPRHASLKLIRYLMKPDLRIIAKSKGVPQAIVLAARRRMRDLDKGK